ncbi:MAG: Fic family protein [Candidatus Margulisbacteria bacterium]|nr:Fic family protein [Candidatus Margulisiibacteriota bacterium]
MTDRYYVSGKHPENKYYPDTYILVNKLNIKNDELLTEFENMALARTVEYFYSQIEKIDKLDSLLLKSIHKYFLEKLYPWAGKFRTVTLKKDKTTFAMPQYIPQLMSDLDNKLADDKYLKKFSLKKLVYYKCELISIHPFREGNGRTIRLFCDLLCLKNGVDRIHYPDNNNDFTVSYMKASEAAVLKANCEPMYKLLKTLL